MAMPSELPPPFDDAPQPPGWTDAEIFALPSPRALVVEPEPMRLMDHVIALARQMAESVDDQIGDVLRRTKSRNWMLGQLRRRTSGRHSDEEIRDAIIAAARQHRPTITDELGPRHVELTSRRPLVFLEASAWPVWGPRVEKLGTLVVYPMTILELTARAKVSLGWTANHVKQTTVAAEDASEIWYDKAFQHWHRTPERIVMADPKKKTKVVRVQRRLLVTLRPEDQAALKDRLRGIKAEKTALENELSETARSLKARIREREEAAERTINAMLEGQEVQGVECEERWDYAAKRVTTVRKDTGAEVDGRDMLPEELQTSIPEAS